MNFSENTNLLPGGQSASPSKVKELENRIDDLAQTVTNVADSVAGLSNEVTTAELNATSANVTNAVVDSATVGTETATTVNADTVNADNLNATDANITNLDADNIDANSVDADNGYFGSVNAQSFTGQGVNITGDITASNKVQGKTVQATEKVVTPALESTTTELKGATTVRGDVYFPENGDKIYGEYLEVEANKVKIKNLTTETPADTNQIVGYDNNGNLIPVDASLDPASLWEPSSSDTIRPKNNKKIEATEITTSTLNAVDVNTTDDLSVGGDATVNGGMYVGGSVSVVGNHGVYGNTTLKNTGVNGTLTVNGDIIQNGSAYETHAEKLYTKKDIIITRDGAVSALGDDEYTGIQATKYDGTNDGQLVFDKDGEARVGDVGDTQPLLTRDEAADLTDGKPLVWDATNKKAVSGTVADTVASGNTNPVTSGAVYTALEDKADKTDIAPIFSTSTSYAIGDMVYYEGTLYKCTTTHSAGAWDISHFTATSVSGEIPQRLHLSIPANSSISLADYIPVRTDRRSRFEIYATCLSLSSTKVSEILLQINPYNFNYYMTEMVNKGINITLSNDGTITNGESGAVELDIMRIY